MNGNLILICKSGLLLLYFNVSALTIMNNYG